MKKMLLISATILFFVACKKENPVGPQFSEASYVITVTGMWQMPQFSVPANAHYTAFSGMVHNGNSSIWGEGRLASAGVEAIAETGWQVPLFTEVDTFINRRQAMAPINFPPPLPQGFISRTVYVNSNYSYLSFISMIAPSPDWFVGVSSLNLNAGNQWTADTVLQLYVYDAGTEDGDVFGYNNPPTQPQQPVQKLTPAKGMALANGNSLLAPMLSVRIKKQ